MLYSLRTDVPSLQFVSIKHWIAWIPSLPGRRSGATLQAQDWLVDVKPRQGGLCSFIGTLQFQILDRKDPVSSQQEAKGNHPLSPGLDGGR